MDRISVERMILVLFENPSQRILPTYYVAATAELARCDGCRRVAVYTRRGQRSRLQPITISITGAGAASDGAWE
jgi:hypothetical protein